MPEARMFNITKDDLKKFGQKGPAFVTFGEVMVRDTPADMERPERTRLVHLSMAGSEYTLAIGLARLGIPSAYITRVPDNPYGRAVRNIARENGVNTDHIVWAPKTEPIGRLIYEIGRTPRRDTGIYQRKYSAASKPGRRHGGLEGRTERRQAVSYVRDHLWPGHPQQLRPQLQSTRPSRKRSPVSPSDCLVGLDFNYRSTLWSVDQARAVMTPIVADHVDVLITTIEDMAELYGIGCGQYSAQQISDGDIGPSGG